MKKIIIALVANALVSTTAFAANTVVAEIKPFDQNIKAVQLLESGLLKVLKTDGTVAKMQLTPTNKQNLVFQSEVLKDAEITTVYQHIVCMMMPAPGLMKKFYVRDNNGRMKLVLGPKGCFLHEHTYPVEEYTRQNADALMEQLIVLANQTAGF